MFLEILQNLQKNTCARVFFLIKLQASGHRFLKNELIQQILYVTHYSEIYINTVIQNVTGRLSLPIFVKISKGKVYAIISAQALKKDRKIFEAICLLFDEMYLKKCEEYFGGAQIGSYENGELYKGIVYSLVL